MIGDVFGLIIMYIDLYVLEIYLDYLEVEVELMLELVFISYVKEEIKKHWKSLFSFDTYQKDIIQIWLSIALFYLSSCCGLLFYIVPFPLLNPTLIIWYQSCTLPH